MANYWQMTLFELDRDSVAPIKKILHPGTWYFSCPICGETVGLWRDPKVDSVTNGMTQQRKECKNGHIVDWAEVKEAK